MKEITNIFTKTKSKALDNPNKIPIIIDTREKQSLVISSLVEKKAKIQIEKLEIGDYLIQNTIIERKTFQDFQSSIINKRLLSQLSEMQKYEKKLLILEGFYYNYQESRIHENALRGMIVSASLDFNIPVIFTENEKDTATYLISIAKRLEKEKPEISIRHKRSNMTVTERKEFILEGFPGIGPTTSKALIEEHKTLKKIFNLNTKDLEKFLDSKKIVDFQNILKE